MENIVELFVANKEKLKPMGFFAMTLVGLYGRFFIILKDLPVSSKMGKTKMIRIVQIEEGQLAYKMRETHVLSTLCCKQTFKEFFLQALSSVETFRKNIQSLLKVKSIPDDHEELIVELSKVIQKINSNNDQISVADFLDILSKTQGNLINFEQQDAHELYSGIVRSFDEFFNNRKSSSLSFSASSQFHEGEGEEDEIENNLIGFTRSSIQCITCGTTNTIKIQSFYDLSLEIEPQFVMNLKSALLWLQRTQKIDNYTCTSCSIKDHISKLQKIENRIEGKHSDDLKMINEKILRFLQKSSFQDLDLGQINQCLSNQVVQFTELFKKIGDNVFRNQIFSEIKAVQRQIIKQTKITKYPRILVIHFRQLTINPYTGEPTYLKKPIDYQENLQIQLKNSTKVYQLTSLLTHIGNQMMGHYFTFRKKNIFERDWYLISDSHTEQCDSVRMKRYAPYMLFYEFDREIYKENDELSKSFREKKLIKQNGNVITDE